MNDVHVARFEAKFIRGSPTECWLWRGAKAAKRKGRQKPYFQPRINIDGITMIASRLSWMFYRGEIPEEAFVLHSCDNPLCVNPAHLFLGNNVENMRDAQSKGRLAHGEMNGRLSEDIVRSINAEKGSCTEIAERYGVGKSHVHRIRREQTWRHLWEK